MITNVQLKIDELIEFSHLSTTMSAFAKFYVITSLCGIPNQYPKRIIPNNLKKKYPYIRVGTQQPQPSNIIVNIFSHLERVV